MNKTIPALLLAVLALTAVAAEADIYHWRDGRGVTHFTNEPPPPGALLIERIAEVPHDAEADRRRMEEERRMLLERQRLEIEERKAALDQREREVRMKLDEADRALKKAREAESRPEPPGGSDCSEEYFLRHGSCIGYPVVIQRTRRGPSANPDLYRGYTRKEGGLYYNEPPPPKPPTPPPAEPKPRRPPAAASGKGEKPLPGAPKSPARTESAESPPAE